MSLVGIGLTLLTLPGAWLMLAVAAACNLWQPGMFSWWTIGVLAGIALLAELIEFGASALGAAKTGGTRSGALGSVAGALLGALAGTPFFPPVGTIAGAILGAGLGALIAERGIANRRWRDSAKVAGGAAAGRLVATVVKASAAAAIALVLIVALFIA
ncbi:MAG: hypothetical protein GIKADHBN_01385 [Phycisphaerales bacterium]|nr:hypothetical protein [Phycisphaerales bacterium]